MKDYAVFTSASRFVVIVCLTASLQVHAGDPIPQEPKAAAPAAPMLNLMKLPLSFERSQNEAAAQVQFIARGQGYSLFLTPSEIVLMLVKGSANSQSELPKHGLRQRLGADEPKGSESSVVRMKMVGANARPRLTGRDELPSKTHYLVGNDPSRWRTNVPNYAKVEYQNLYPGVDLMFYGNQGRLEFDFIVSPGSDPGQVQLDFDGADSVELEANGDLVLRSAGSEIHLRKPLTYQRRNGGRQELPSSYVLLDRNRLGFRVSGYDANETLVIDPVLAFSSYVGGGASGVSLDPNGNVYVASTTFKQDWITTPGALQPSGAGFSDVFIMKLSPDGSSLSYATYLGGSQNDFANAIAVDSAGSAIITGSTISSNFPAMNARSGGRLDAFVAKLNPAGSGLIYSTYLGGKPRFEMEPLSIDFGMVTLGQTKDAIITVRNIGTIPFSVCAGMGGGAVRFVGTTDSCIFGNQFDPFDAKITVGALSQASFTVRFDPKSFLGRGHDLGSIGFHNGDQSIFAQIPWKGEGILPPFPPDPPPQPDNTFYRNTPPWFIYSGDAEDFAADVAVDQAGNAYVAGTTGSANFPAPNSIYNGGTFGTSVSDAFVTKFSPQGQMLFSTLLGDSGYDVAEAIAVDGAGNSYVSGRTGSTNFVATTALHRTPGNDGFIAKLNPAGGRLYSTLVGGVVISGIAVDESGAAYITGSGGLAELPTPNAFQSGFAGGRDAFVAKLDPTGSSFAYFTRLGGSADEEANAIAVDAFGSAYVTGYTQSPNFPPKEPVQATYGGGAGFFGGDAFITQLTLDGSALVFSTYLGGPGNDAGLGIALDKSGGIYVVGSTEGDFPLTNSLPGWTTPSGGFVARVSIGTPAREIQLWQKIEIAAPTQATDGPTSFKVEFVRMVSGSEIRAQAEVLAVRSNTVTVRVPPALLGPTDVPAPPVGTDPNVRVEVIRVATAQEIAREALVLRFPQPIIVDEVDVRQGSPALRTLSQFVLGAPSPNIHTFSFLGRSSDGLLAARAINTDLRFPLPLRFETDDVAVLEPEPGTGRLKLLGTPFHIPNLGPGNQGLQFNVSQNGLYVIAIEANTNSPGPFPARYQLHLAGNVGLPRKLINGVAEQPRGTRLNTLFNHPAPHSQGLFPDNIGVARTALFKFENAASISQFARAVLTPPAGGFTAGTRIIRASDPTAPLELTTPTARTPDSAAPVIGTVIDFTQVPIPESLAQPPAPPLSETAGAVLGQNDGNGLTLPKTFPNGVTLSSLILDMGSGTEIVDGAGADFEVMAATGSYSVRVGNSPYVESFSAIPGTFTGVQQIDLATVDLKSARYVWIIAAPGVVLDAVRSLNVFADEISPTIGAITHVTSATITVRRAKDPANLLDPFLQLIAPNGDLFAENEAGFGDDLSQDLSDSAIINRILPQDGFYRYLVKGYDKQPDNQSSGTFFTRLETSGNYDPIELVVISASEEQTPAQKTGMISATRQRDSFLFQAQPGQAINIVVNATGNLSSLNPLFELYDPEDFLIAMSDDFPGRGRNAAASLILPAVSVAGPSLPNPSTYRVVVSAIDGFGSSSPLSTGNAHIRQAVSGNYELKVFTGALTGAPPGGVPRIDLINPASGLPGTQVTLSGANFSATASSNLVLFGSAQATVVTASATQLIVVVPAGLPAGAASVTVRVGGQTSAPTSFQISVPVTRTAASRLNCLSLRFLPAIVRFLGEDFTLELTTVDEPVPSNGELFSLFDPLDFSHGSNVRLRAPNPSDSISGFIVLDVPMTTDADRDGVADFFQVSAGVGSTQTQGEYFVDLDDGTLTATWSRAAGSKTGACRVVLRSTTLGQVADFTNAFELLEYSGLLTYTPGSNNVTGAVQFTQTQSSSSTLTGPIQLTRSLTDRFNELQFSSGRWTNGVGLTLSYRSGVLQRVSVSSSNYFGSLGFLDGDLATTDEDYFDWILSVRDTNDADGDSVPDLSDDPSVGSLPVFARPRLEAGQIVLEWQGAGKLQSASEVTGPWADVIGAASPFRQTPVGARQYFRIAL